MYTKGTNHFMQMTLVSYNLHLCSMSVVRADRTVRLALLDTEYNRSLLTIRTLKKMFSFGFTIVFK